MQRTTRSGSECETPYGLLYLQIINGPARPPSTQTFLLEVKCVLAITPSLVVTRSLIHGIINFTFFNILSWLQEDEESSSSDSSSSSSEVPEPLQKRARTKAEGKAKAKTKAKAKPKAKVSTSKRSQSGSITAAFAKKAKKWQSPFFRGCIHMQARIGTVKWWRCVIYIYLSVQKPPFQYKPELIVQEHKQLFGCPKAHVWSWGLEQGKNLAWKQPVRPRNKVFARGTSPGFPFSNGLF